MPEREAIVFEAVPTKETKGTFMFTEVEDGGVEPHYDPRVGTVYVKKGWTGRTAPARIRVTIEELEG